jgi:plasmid stabilization system protein ParE
MAAPGPAGTGGRHPGASISPLPHVAVYRVKEQSIEVLRIFHAAQQRP